MTEAKKAAIFILSLYFIFALTPFAFANVIINEIAWMGTTKSPNDEWIELFNNAPTPINLNGWKIESVGKKIAIDLNGQIPGWGFFLLERGDNDTLPNIRANLIYHGALGNDGMVLKLFNDQGQVVEEIDCADHWFAGDNKTKQTMARKNPEETASNPLNWGSSQDAEGTPVLKNNFASAPSSSQILIDRKESIEEKQEDPKQPSIPMVISKTQDIYPIGIIFNEILPAPKGSDAESEWLELYNTNKFTVDLSGWQIRDKVGAVKKHIFPQGGEVLGYSYLIVTRPQTNITLQNTGDGLELLNPRGIIVDQIDYQKPPTGQSWNKTVDGSWKWSAALTPGKPNIITNQIAAAQSDKTNQITTSPAALTIKPNNEELLASLNTSAKKPSRPMLNFLIGLGVAAISAIAVLVIKKNNIARNYD